MFEQEDESRGFSFDDYSSALGVFAEAGYAITGFGDYLDNPRPKHLVLRHDVDNSMEQALRVARLDAETGCRSTFFLRVHAQGYNLASLPALVAIREIERLGHEVELHVECGLHRVLGDDELGWAERQRTVFEELVGRSIRGFSIHEPARLGGRGLADQLLRRWRGAVRYHAYEERFMLPRMKYLSDSSGRWREGHFRLWVDRAPLIQVLTHPFWWYERTPAENY